MYSTLTSAATLALAVASLKAELDPMADLTHSAESKRHIATVLARRLLTAAHASGRDVHKEHEAIFRAVVDRQEARAALALEAHIRLTHDIVRLQASQAALK